jgi:hypothetical protein
MAWRRRRRTQVFEDPRLEVTSSLDISLGAQFALLDSLRGEMAGCALSRGKNLPPMAEGWGEGHPD